MASHPVARFLRSSRFHFMMTIVWVGMAVPALLWWKNSILFVIFLSLYANFIGHYSAYQAARSEETNE